MQAYGLMSFTDIGLVHRALRSTVKGLRENWRFPNQEFLGLGVGRPFGMFT